MNLLNKKENNKETLLWIFKRSKKFLPNVIALSVIAIIDALIFVFLALASKSVLDIAVGAKEGSLLGAGILIFGLIFLHISFMALQ